MALNTSNPHNEVVVGPIAPALSTSTTTLYVAVPVSGNLVRAYQTTVSDGSTAAWTYIVTAHTSAAADGLGTFGTGTVTASASNGTVSTLHGTAVHVNQGDIIGVTNVGEATSSARVYNYQFVIRV